VRIFSRPAETGLVKRRQAHIESEKQIYLARQKDAHIDASAVARFF
jgi:hypothetical protein